MVRGQTLRLDLSGVDLGETGVDVGKTLARGGMAVVHLGEQRKLGRSVAVKTVQSDDPADFERLLREAKITSRLEHPNIVPVHDIFVDEDGTPQVVLKLIEGDTWAKLMRDEAVVRDRFGAEDLLTWNLDVIIAVCRALSFAHSRGVIHRDVKPANVMVGAFGEVYLLDWGIAHEMDYASTGVGRLVSDTLAGTAAYMAPEQLEGDVALVGPWTDVYLLGATLFHALVGLAPHAGKSHEERCVDVVRRLPAPRLPDEVPVELRRLIERAMAFDRADRVPDVETFRRALVEYAHHRSANRLAQRGNDEREIAERAVRDRDEEAALRSLLAAEVSYRAAIDEWPGCESAIEGSLRVATMRIEHALRVGEPHLAQRLARASPRVSGALRARVEEAVATADADAERLHRIATDVDLGIGHRARGVLGVVFGAVFLCLWTWTALEPPATVWPMVWTTVGFWSISTLGVLVGAKAMLATRRNRTVLVVLTVSLAALVAWFIGAEQLGLGVVGAQIGVLLILALATMGVAVTIHFLGLFTPVGFLIAFLVACFRPDWTPHAIVGGSTVMLLNHVLLNLFVTGKNREL